MPSLIALTDLARYALKLLHIGCLARITDDLEPADGRQLRIALIVRDKHLCVCARAGV